MKIMRRNLKRNDDDDDDVEMVMIEDDNVHYVTVAAMSI